MKKGAVFIVLVVVIFLIFGGVQLSIISQGGVKAIFVETPQIEIMEGGTILVDVTVNSYPADDESYLLYYEIFDGTKFIANGGLRRIEHNKNNYRFTTWQDQLGVSGFEQGQHILTYKFYWSPSNSERSCTNTLTYKEDGVTKTHKYICKYHAEFYNRVNINYRNEMRVNLDRSKQYSKYLAATMYKNTEQVSICVGSCDGEIQFIDKIIYEDRIVYVDKIVEVFSFNGFIQWLKNLLGI